LTKFTSPGGCEKRSVSLVGSIWGRGAIAARWGDRGIQGLGWRVLVGERSGWGTVRTHWGGSEQSKLGWSVEKKIGPNHGSGRKIVGSLNTKKWGYL